MRKLRYAEVIGFESMQELPVLLREMAVAVEALREAQQFPVSVSIGFSADNDDYGWDGILVVE